MNNIKIFNTIEESKISISFDLQDGSLSFPLIELATAGDIELNPLIIKLTGFLELNRKIEITYEDSDSFLVNDSKIKLIKETLDDIYDSFNSNILNELEDPLEDLDF